MSWHFPTGVSSWKHARRAPASPTTALGETPTLEGSHALAEQRVMARNVRGSTLQPESAEGPLKCCSLADGLKVCWKIDRGRLTADVSLNPPDGSPGVARLTNTRPIGELAIRGKTVQAEMLAAMDVLRHQIYLKGWATSGGRRREIDKVLD